MNKVFLRAKQGVLCANEHASVKVGYNYDGIIQPLITIQPKALLWFIFYVLMYNKCFLKGLIQFN